MKRLAWSAVVTLLLAAPFAAQAADGYVTGNVNMRAGPDVQYPLIDQIPAGSEVSIQGCTSGWEWCDVIASGNRGWVAGNFIQYEYQNQRVLLPSYGVQIGIPIVSFVIGTYWNNYYRSRPFYRQRNSWYNRPIVHRPPPRPIARPPGHRPPPARPRPPINHAPKPRPPINNRPRPQPRPPVNRPQPKPPVNRPQPRPPVNQRPQTRPSPVNKGPANRPAGNRPAAPSRKPQGKPRPKQGDDKHGN
ncbi:MAG TPA: SH3 domain-containing protein [Rhodanobacter sp.]